MARDHSDQFEYDVALSFAGVDRAVAEQLAKLLLAKNIRVLYDEFQTAEPGDSDFVTHIAEIYRTKARYCVIFISQHYPLQQWTEVERTAVREHALRAVEEGILPVRLDDSDIADPRATSSYT